MPRAVCTVPGCDASVVGRGWCQMHYGRWRRRGETDDPAKSVSFVCSVCSVDGCGRPYNAKGLCRGHYDRVRRTGEPGAATFRPGRVPAAGLCQTSGCRTPTVTMGLCKPHYDQARRARLRRPPAGDDPPA